MHVSCRHSSLQPTAQKCQCRALSLGPKAPNPVYTQNATTQHNPQQLAVPHTFEVVGRQLRCRRLLQPLRQPQRLAAGGVGRAASSCVRRQRCGQQLLVPAGIERAARSLTSVQQGMAAGEDDAGGQREVPAGNIRSAVHEGSNEGRSSAPAWLVLARCTACWNVLRRGLCPHRLTHTQPRGQRMLLAERGRARRANALCCSSPAHAPQATPAARPRYTLRNRAGCSGTSR